MQEIIKNVILITTITMTTIYSIIRFFSYKKKRLIKFEAIERISIEIERLRHEKRFEQLKIVSERSDILFSEFLKVFCKNMGVIEDSKEAYSYESFILHNVRKRTDKLMEEVIDRNNLANREGLAWENYKKSKFEYILTLMIRYIKEIWRENLIGYPHEKVVEKCRKDIIEVYMHHINGMFEEIRTICRIYELSKIKNQKKILNALKNGLKIKNEGGIII